MEFIYHILHHIGFNHPLHPPWAHMPIGLVIGAFIFFIVAVALRRDQFKKTAHHCFVLALIFFFPTVFFGFTDWWHFYGGIYSFAIKVKLVLSGVLLILLAAGFIMAKKTIGGHMSKFIVYMVSVLVVMALGYCGAQLALEESNAEVSAGSKSGESYYLSNCNGCHPNGGNSINPKIPVVGSSALKDLNRFTGFIRNPLRPDGSKGVMPAFQPDKLSNEDLKSIYQFIETDLSRRH